MNLFETTGSLDEALFKELGNQIIPDIIKVFLKLMAVIGLVAGCMGIISIPQGHFSLAVTSLMLAVFCILFYFIYQWYLRQRYIRWNINCILETTN